MKLPPRATPLVLLIACIVLTSAGCRRRKNRDTVVNRAGIFTTDEFPGAPVQNGNTADDKRAMSPSSLNFNDEMKVTFNGERGTAMVTYQAEGVIYAHYFDGETWTPPVALGALDCQYDFGVNGRQIVHAFLNTDGHSSEAARERSGDCIIFWSAPDTDGDGGAAVDGENRCLWATYFDETLHADPERRFGFQLEAVRLNSQDEDFEDVRTFGVASDGAVGEAAWGPNRNDVKWGDETTSITVFWHQFENNDGFPGTEDEATWFAWYDLTAPGDPELPLLPSVDARISTVDWGASDSGTDSQETLVDGRYVTYNNVLFMRAGADESSSGSDFSLGNIRFDRNFGNQTVNRDDDITIQATSFDLAAGTRSPTVSLHQTSPDATDAIENSAEFIREDGGFFRGRHVFGSDEGLACLVFPFVQLVQDPDGNNDFGDIANDGRLAIAEIDEETGALIAQRFLDTEQLTTSDTVDEGDVDARLSRNGDYIWFAWRERSEAGAADDIAIWAAQYVTTRPDEDGVFVLPAIDDATSSAIQVSVDVDFESATWFAFQAGLNYVCGSQSDPDVMNLFFERSDFIRDEVFAVRLTADLAVTPVVPATLTSSVEVFEDFVQSFIGGVVNDEGLHFRACDSGEGGNWIAFYVRDIDPVDTDLRIFARRTGAGAGTVEIGSGIPSRQMLFGGRIRVSILPKGTEIGRFDTVSMEDDPARTHPAQIVHVYFQETEETRTPGVGYALRTRRFRVIDDGTSLGDLFVPTAGAAFLPPFDLDLPFMIPDTAQQAEFIAASVSEFSVGLWFSEANHLYYQESNLNGPDDDSIGWHDDGGVSDPYLIDDDSGELVEDFIMFRRPSDTCESLGNAMIFWTRSYEEPGGPTDRLHVRVRYGDGN